MAARILRGKTPILTSKAGGEKNSFYREDILHSGLLWYIATWHAQRHPAEKAACING
jgi:hypothetical protein